MYRVKACLILINTDCNTDWGANANNIKTHLNAGFALVLTNCELNFMKYIRKSMRNKWMSYCYQMMDKSAWISLRCKQGFSRKSRSMIGLCLFLCNSRISTCIALTSWHKRALHWAGFQQNRPSDCSEIIDIKYIFFVCFQTYYSTKPVQVNIYEYRLLWFHVYRHPWKSEVCRKIPNI